MKYFLICYLLIIPGYLAGKFGEENIYILIASFLILILGCMLLYREVGD